MCNLTHFEMMKSKIYLHCTLGKPSREKTGNSLDFCQTRGGGYPPTKLLSGFRLFPWKKTEIVPNFAKGGGGTPPLVKKQTISFFSLVKASLILLEDWRYIYTNNKTPAICKLHPRHPNLTQSQRTKMNYKSNYC